MTPTSGLGRHPGPGTLTGGGAGPPTPAPGSRAPRTDQAGGRPATRRIQTILSLCDFTGNWSRPYADAGYEVVQVDIQHGQDVRFLPYPGRVHGILAAPPCTHFAASGARWWKDKGQAAVLEGLAVVDACLRLVAVCRPVWWVMENPVGRLRHWLGPPAWSFDPCDFGDPYTKRTHLWGQFIPPVALFAPTAQLACAPSLGSKMHRMSGRATAARSATPEGFARAFFEANP